MYKKLLCSCLFLVFLSEKAIGMVDKVFYEEMITYTNKMENTIKNMTSITFGASPELKYINDIVTNLSREITQLKAELQKIEETNDITPEEAGNIVRQIELKDSLLLFNESSSQSLTKSFEDISKILKEGNNNSILKEPLTALQKTALKNVIECFANASPGELSYSFNDEEQYNIICAAKKTYKEVL